MEAEQASLQLVTACTEQAEFTAQKDGKPDTRKDKKSRRGGGGGRWRCLSTPEASPAGGGRLSSFQPPLETGDA